MSGLYWTAAVVFVVVVASVIAAGWYASGKVIHPPHDPPRDPSPFDLPLASVHFQSCDGLRLAGWFIPGTNGATVILARGRGSDHSYLGKV